jgi:serine/threonine protein kinase
VDDNNNNIFSHKIKEIYIINYLHPHDYVFNDIKENLMKNENSFMFKLYDFLAYLHCFLYNNLNY